MQALTPADVNAPPGTAIVTPFLNVRGGIESLPVTARLSREAWLVLTGPGQAVRDADWIGRHLPSGSRVRLEDVTVAWALLALVGPNAARVLEPLTSNGLGEAVPAPGTLRDVEFGPVQGRLLRCPWAGEWQVLVRAEHALGLYDALRDAGAGWG